MSEEHISQEFRLKNIDETRNQFIEEINQNELMNITSSAGRIKICVIIAGMKKKHKKRVFLPKYKLNSIES